MHDSTEGLIGSATRKVWPGGRVQLNNSWFQSADLEPYVGQKLLTMWHGLCQVQVVPSDFRTPGGPNLNIIADLVED